MLPLRTGLLLRSTNWILSRNSPQHQPLGSLLECWARASTNMKSELQLHSAYCHTSPWEGSGFVPPYETQLHDRSQVTKQRERLVEGYQTVWKLCVYVFGFNKKRNRQETNNLLIHVKWGAVFIKTYIICKCRCRSFQWALQSAYGAEVRNNESSLRSFQYVHKEEKVAVCLFPQICG